MFCYIKGEDLSSNQVYEISQPIFMSAIVLDQKFHLYDLFIIKKTPLFYTAFFGIITKRRQKRSDLRS